MRGNIGSSFRRIQNDYSCKFNVLGPSAAAKRFGWSNRVLSTTENTKKLKLAPEEFICPIKYFREEVKLLDSLAGNDLLGAVGGQRGKTLVAWKAGRAIRSLPELIAKHHERGDAVGPALRLDNLGISRSEGKFGFLDTSGIGPAEKPGSLRNDWKLGGDCLEKMAEKVLGNTRWPSDLSNYINLMRSVSPKNFRQLFYNSLFLGPRARYWLRVFIDQRFRNDGDSLPRETKHKVQDFLGKLPYEYGGPEVEGSMLWIAAKNEVFRGAMKEARVEAQMRRKREEKRSKQKKTDEERTAEEKDEERTAEEKDEERTAEENDEERTAEEKDEERTAEENDEERTAEENDEERTGEECEEKTGEEGEEKTGEDKWKRDTGRWLVCVNRGVLTHGTKTKRKYLKKVNRRMLTAENIWSMIHLEFDDLDQEYIKLCDEEDILWKILGIEEIFYETPDTWKRAREALKRDIVCDEDGQESFEEGHCL